MKKLLFASFAAFLLVAIASKAQAGFVAQGALVNTTGTSLALTGPANPVSGHLWVAIFWGSGIAGLNTPSGWANKTIASQDSDRRIAIETHCVAGGDTGQTFTINSAGNGSGGIITEWNNINCAGSFGISSGTGSPVTFSPSTLTASVESDAIEVCGDTAGLGATTGISNAFNVGIASGGSTSFSGMQGAFGRVGAGTVTPSQSSMRACVFLILPPAATDTEPNLHAWADSACGSTSCSATAPGSPGTPEAIFFATRFGNNNSTATLTVPSGFIVTHGPDGLTSCSSNSLLEMGCKNSTGAEPGTYTFSASVGNVLGVRMWTVEHAKCPAVGAGSFTQSNAVTNLNSATLTTTTNNAIVQAAGWWCGAGPNLYAPLGGPQEFGTTNSTSEAIGSYAQAAAGTSTAINLKSTSGTTWLGIESAAAEVSFPSGSKALFLGPF